LTPDPWASRHQLAGRLDPIQPRHLQVHHNHVSFKSDRRIDRLVPVARHPDALELIDGHK
jgi:hypothetical protein